MPCHLTHVIQNDGRMPHLLPQQQLPHLLLKLLQQQQTLPLVVVVLLLLLPIQTPSAGLRVALDGITTYIASGKGLRRYESATDHQALSDQHEKCDCEQRRRQQRTQAVEE